MHLHRLCGTCLGIADLLRWGRVTYMALPTVRLLLCGWVGVVAPLGAQARLAKFCTRSCESCCTTLAPLPPQSNDHPQLAEPADTDSALRLRPMHTP